MYTEMDSHLIPHSKIMFSQNWQAKIEPNKQVYQILDDFSNVSHTQSIFLRFPDNLSETQVLTHITCVS